jgi:hypothetical protein
MHIPREASSGLPWTHDLPASISSVVGFQACIKTLGCYIKCHEVFPLCCLLNVLVFQVFHLKFQSILILLHVDMHFLKTICWRDHSFSIVYPVHLDWRSFDHICEGLVPTSPFFSLVCVSFRPLSFSFNYCRFVICFEVRKWVHFSMFTFSGLFWLCSVLWDSIY